MLKDLYLAHIKKQCKLVPTGFQTVKEWAKSEGKSINAIERMLNTLSEPGGPIERKMYPIMCNNGHIRQVVHFRKK